MLVPPPPPLLPPPQPSAPKEMKSVSRPNRASQLRRRGTANSSSSASAVPPAEVQSEGLPLLTAVVGAVVKTVSVEVLAVLPLTLTDCGVRLQVGRSLGFVIAVVTWQERFTVPEKPFAPEIERVAVFPVVAPGVTVIVVLPPLPPIVKVGAAVTVRARVAVADKVLELPVIVIVTGPPSVAELLAVSVRVLELVAVGFGLKLAVTPLGNPLAVRLTPPVKPFAGVIVIVSVLSLAPWAMDSVLSEAAMVKLGGSA